MVEFERFMYGIFGSFPDAWIVVTVLCFPLCILCAWADYSLFDSMRLLERKAYGQMAVVCVGWLFSLVLGLFAASAIICRQCHYLPGSE